jgi:hypothetical protein
VFYERHFFSLLCFSGSAFLKFKFIAMKQTPERVRSRTLSFPQSPSLSIYSAIQASPLMNATPTPPLPRASIASSLTIRSTLRPKHEDSGTDSSEYISDDDDDDFVEDETTEQVPNVVAAPKSEMFDVNVLREWGEDVEEPVASSSATISSDQSAANPPSLPVNHSAYRSHSNSVDEWGEPIAPSAPVSLRTTLHATLNAFTPSSTGIPTTAAISSSFASQHVSFIGTTDPIAAAAAALSQQPQLANLKLEGRAEGLSPRREAGNVPEHENGFASVVIEGPEVGSTVSPTSLVRVSNTTLLKILQSSILTAFIGCLDQILLAWYGMCVGL